MLLGQASEIKHRDPSKVDVDEHRDEAGQATIEADTGAVSFHSLRPFIQHYKSKRSPSGAISCRTMNVATGSKPADKGAG